MTDEMTTELKYMYEESDSIVKSVHDEYFSHCKLLKKEFEYVIEMLKCNEYVFFSEGLRDTQNTIMILEQLSICSAGFLGEEHEEIIADFETQMSNIIK